MGPLNNAWSALPTVSLAQVEALYALPAILHFTGLYHLENAFANRDFMSQGLLSALLAVSHV